MAGVFELIKGHQKRLVGHRDLVQRTDPRSLELQAAKEILAETFGIRISEVDEMIQNRSEEVIYDGISTAEGLWPMEFCLNEKELAD